MMLHHNPKKACLAISFESVSFFDLEYYLKKENLALERISPNDFLKTGCDSRYQVINLTIKDMTLRRQVSEAIDAYGLERFSYVHPAACVETDQVSPGTLIHPMTTLMRGAVSGVDVIYFSYAGIAHNVQVGRGCMINAYAMIAGTSQVGDYCTIHSRATVYDKVSICSDVVVAAESIVRKNITEPGVYATVRSGVFKKINAL
jgi:acetyltransferase-like isoleucine patch superfamily enzyme